MKKEETYARELISVIQKISRDKKLLREFLLDLLTPQEFNELPKRWQIVKRLAKGMPQRQIAKELDVSIATITRGSRELLDKKGGFQRTLNRLAQKARSAKILS